MKNNKLNKIRYGILQLTINILYKKILYIFGYLAGILEFSFE